MNSALEWWVSLYYYISKGVGEGARARPAPTPPFQFLTGDKWIFAPTFGQNEWYT